ncbi:MAG: glycosyltransferase family 2 protein [Clostridia bacterium]|nr:glycosyltransferase family 2 protein [Clostridia bacterium]
MRPETVSVCIVAYNEEKFLPNLFSDLNAQIYPHDKIEIILVDSMSTDNTRKVMRDFADANTGRFIDIKVVENKRKVQAAGWNVAILNSTCDVITRIDAHTSVPPEFVQLNMDNIREGEYVSGGVRPCVTENQTLWGAALLQTENSLFGSSISKARSGTKKEYVKTMFHASYRREVFSEVGGFNENLLRTEDNEMHYRIRQAGYKFCFDPQIISYQYARNSLKKMIKQKYGNGYWIGLTLGVSPHCISVYHFIPFLFIMGIILTTVMAMLGVIWPLIAMWGLYLLFGVVSVFHSIKEHGFNVFYLMMPFHFFILHISYGVGTLFGLIQMPFRRNALKKCDTIQIVKDYVTKSLKKEETEQ